MKALPLWPLSALLALGTPLAAQSLQEALGHIPARAGRVEAIRDWSATRNRAKAVLQKPDALPSELEEVIPGLKLDPTFLAPGPLVKAAFPLAKGKGEQLAYWVPVKDFAATVRQLKATRSGSAYQVKGAKGTFLLAKRGAFACVTVHADLAKELAGPVQGLGEEMAAIRPWMETHDLIMVVPEATTRAALTIFQAGLEAPDTGSNPMPQLKAMKALLGPLAKNLADSIHHVAIAADFQTDGSLKGVARAFFTPGSPLAVAGAAQPAPTSHPLEGLKPTGFLLAMGGPWPSAMNDYVASITRLVMKDDPSGPQRAELQAKVGANLLGQAFSFGLPGEAGSPILAGLRSCTTVKDVTAYFEQASALAELPQPQLEALGLKLEYEKDTLPGTPSATTTLTLVSGQTKIPGLPPAQLKVVLSLLTGNPDKITWSTGRVDDHTVMGTFGGPEALKAALAEYAPGFGKDPRVAAIDALLPRNASWRFYVDLESIRSFTQNMLETFAPKPDRKPLPALPPNPPLEAAITFDAQGIEMAAAAAPESVKALQILVDQIPSEKKTPKAPAPKASKKATRKQ